MFYVAASLSILWMFFTAEICSGDYCNYLLAEHMLLHQLSAATVMGALIAGWLFILTKRHWNNED